MATWHLFSEILVTLDTLPMPTYAAQATRAVHLFDGRMPDEQVEDPTK